MKLYAETGKLRRIQIVGDLLMAAWVGFWLWAGVSIYRLIEKLALPGDQLVEASNEVGEQSGKLPNLLSPVRGGLDSIGDGLRSAGDAQIDAVHGIALFVAIFVFVWPVLPVLATYVTRRLLWMRLARAALVLRRLPNFEELMARRAVFNQPLHRLAAVSSDPVGDLDAGHYSRLAALELGRYGLLARPHRPAGTVRQ